MAEDSRALLAASLSVALVKNDDQGNTRLAKRGSNNTARDDVAAALVLAAGHSREKAHHESHASDTPHLSKRSGRRLPKGWPALRRLALDRDGWRCRSVECVPGKLEVDHRIPVNVRPDLELDIDNCQTLCRGCHLAKSRGETGQRVLSPERLACGNGWRPN